jgi:two-component system, NarL family, nitrate/nitrite response regulator NarL
MRRNRILCVDDHAVVRESLVLLMTHRMPDCRITESDSLAQTLNVLATVTDLDLVLLDLDLPDSVGLDTLRSVRGAAPEVPVVVLSTHDEPHLVAGAIECGASSFLCKSSRSSELLAALAHVVEGGVALPLADRAAADLEMTAARQNMATLSDRQRDVLRLLVHGKPNKVIAQELELSEATVKTHMQAAYRRLNVASRVQAVRVVALSGGLL